MYSSFLHWDVTFTQTQWNLAKIDEFVTKTCKTHKKHRIDRIQTYISLKINKLEVWKLVTTLEIYSSFFSWDVILLETEWNLAKIDESVNKTCKTHKKHRIDRIQTCISLKTNQLEIWKLVTRLKMYSSFLHWDVTLLKLNGTYRKLTNLLIKQAKHIKNIVLTGYKRVYLWK